jgi:hypothetical protein
VGDGRYLIAQTVSSSACVADKRGPGSCWAKAQSDVTCPLAVACPSGPFGNIPAIHRCGKIRGQNESPVRTIEKMDSIVSTELVCYARLFEAPGLLSKSLLYH